MSAIQLLSAINYKGCEEKKEFKLVLDSDVNVQNFDKQQDQQAQSKSKKNKKMRELLDIEEAVEETEEIVLLDPENLQTINSKGLEILN
jgi:hypothetical protein